MNDSDNAQPAAGAGGHDPGLAAHALGGIKVLDMARVLAGPWAAQLLADFGAEVIKIEHPQRGDDSRSWEPSFRSQRQPELAQSAYFCSANRNKKSLTLDFAKPAGADLIRALVPDCDVLIENYKVGTLARYGLDYPTLSKINPGLIYCSITGFGQTGPYRGRAGYDTIIQAMGGMMSLTGFPEGDPGAGPVRAGLPVIDLLTGLYAALAVTAALRHRERTGLGQYIDLGLLDVHVAALSYFGTNFLASGTLPRRTGNSNPVTFPSGTFASADGPVVLLVGNDEQFRRFCGALGLPELVGDARFKTSADRVEHAALLTQAIAPTLARHGRNHWVDELERVGVPCAPINDLQQVFANPQVQARQGVRAMDHSQLGAIPVLSNPVRMSASPIRYDRAPPMLGEDTDEVLAAAGLSAADIARLREAGVV